MKKNKVLVLVMFILSVPFVSAFRVRDLLPRVGSSSSMAIAAVVIFGFLFLLMKGARNSAGGFRGAFGYRRDSAGGVGWWLFKTAVWTIPKITIKGGVSLVRHRPRIVGGLYRLGKGGRGLIKRRKEAKAEEKLLWVDRTYDKYLKRFGQIGDQLTKDEEEMDAELISLEEFRKKLAYWKKVADILMEIVKRINKNLKLIEKGGMNEEVINHVRVLSTQAINLQRRVVAIMDRLVEVIRREEELINKEGAEDIKGKAIARKEAAIARRELINEDEEMRKARDELKTATDRAEIKAIHRKMGKIYQRLKSSKKELKDAKREYRDEERIINYERLVKERLEAQEIAIKRLDYFQEAIDNNRNLLNNPDFLSKYYGSLKEYSKILRKPVLGHIKRLAAMHRDVDKLHRKATSLEYKRKHWSSQEEKYYGKEVAAQELEAA